MACHSNAVYKCAITSWQYDNFNLFAANAAHWWGVDESLYQYSLENYSGDVFIATGRNDPFTIYANGAGYMQSVNVDSNDLWSEALVGDEWIYDLTTSDSRVDQNQYWSLHSWRDVMDSGGWEDYMEFAP